MAAYFDKAAKLYADPRVRPVYPAAVFDKVFAFAGDGCTETAVDIATGSGQCARHLACRYQQVWALDASEEQIKRCQPQAGVTFVAKPAEQTDLPAHSVDLVTVATALHWLDIQRFYNEARRILRPGGTLAAFCYSLPEILDSKEAKRLLHEYYFETLAPYHNNALRIFKSQYHGVEPKETMFAVVERAVTSFQTKSTLRHVIEFVNTAGITGKMRQEKPDDQPDPVEKLQQDLMAALNTSDENMELTLNYPVFMILAKEPRPQ